MSTQIQPPPLSVFPSPAVSSSCSEIKTTSTRGCERTLLWFGKCRVVNRGYYRISSGPRKHQYLHRAVWEHVAGRELPEGWHVHHQDFDKLHCCPENLIAMPPEFNPSPAKRCAHTGQWLSIDEYKERMGYTWECTDTL